MIHTGSGVSVSAAFILILLGVVLIFVSSIVPSLPLGAPPAGQPQRSISLWNLGWGFVLTGVLLVGRP